MELLSGNEAIAQGAWEAGARIGVAYPGTPSTETLEAFAKKDGVYAEWCVNEKVAVEVGIGASAGGARVLSTMKHVGVNVAADPLFTAAYTGVGGGFVVLAADDPGMYSSQNEQDSHYYACAAHIPMLDPADSAEALAFTRDAFELSERFDVPFFIRSSVRVSHTKTPVEVGSRKEVEPAPYESNPAKWVMMPAFAKPRRKVQLERIEALSEWAETCAYNQVVRRGDKVGVVCAGAVSQHVLEGLPDASVFKLGCTWPLPKKALRSFAESVDALYVVEEASRYLTDAVSALGIDVASFPEPLPRDGELSVGLIRAAFGFPEPAHAAAQADVPGRPPALCPGCPHRLVFKELSRCKAIVTGDIGCYTLGNAMPLDAVDTCLCMGAGITMAQGFSVVEPQKKALAFVGDSTFFASGLTGIANAVYNGHDITVCVLDNATTAMTGSQPHPGTGVTLMGPHRKPISIEAVLKALGVECIVHADPLDLEDSIDEAKRAIDFEGPSAILFESPCVQLVKPKASLNVNVDMCTGCKKCITEIGCPGLGFDQTRKGAKSKDRGQAFVDASLCNGCGLCVQVCPFKAIELPGNAEEKEAPHA